MRADTILLPLCAQVLITFLVWSWMYYMRISATLRSRIDVQELDNHATFDRVLGHVVNPSDNFENQFELPVLFYVVCLAYFMTGFTDMFSVVAAWTFVILRALHSLIHCTYNRIMHRFATYFIGALVLWAMWIEFAIQLIPSVQTAIQTYQHS